MASPYRSRDASLRLYADMGATRNADASSAFSDQTDRSMPSARRILARGLGDYPLVLAGRSMGVFSEGQIAHVHVRSSIY